MNEFVMYVLAGMTGGAIGGILSTCIVLSIIGFYRSNKDCNQSNHYQWKSRF